jgi:hypothetical protein
LAKFHFDFRVCLGNQEVLVKVFRNHQLLDQDFDFRLDVMTKRGGKLVEFVLLVDFLLHFPSNLVGN